MQNSVSFAKALAVSRLKATKRAFLSGRNYKTEVLQFPLYVIVYVIVSRQELIDSAYSTLICAPVYTNYEGLSTQVPVSVEEGLKHLSAIRCDELISILKTKLTDYVEIFRNQNSLN